MRRALAVAVALLVVTCSAVADAGAAPRSLALRVPTGATAAPGWRTPPLHAAGGFSLVGGEWRGGGRVELRARRASGRWTRWVRIVAGEPVWSGRAVAVQLRGARPLRGLRVHAVAVGRAPAAAARAVAAAGSAGGAGAGGGAGASGAPAIVPRSAWDPHDSCRPRVQARYGRVDFALVHHTESLSSYPPSQSAAIVLGICLFHRDGNRWNDIGYDLLVDRYGTVFEGRAGGVGQPVIGAQAGGWNAVSTGIAMIGSWSLTTPPPAALGALERLLAWKLSLAGVPAQGGVTERSTGGDPADNRHPRGSLVRYPRIAGHRDADSTDCPGAALYAELPQIRRAVAALMAAPRDLLTLSPVGAPIEPAPWSLTGRLALASGSRPAGAAVRVEQHGADGAWHEVAATRTGADGIWSAAPTLLVNGALRAVATLPDGRSLASPAVDAQVRAGVRLRVMPRRPRRGGTIQLVGATSPPKARVRVRIARRAAASSWRSVRTLALATDARGGFAASVTLRGAGLFRVRATTRADALNAAGASRAISVRVGRR